MLYPEYKVSTKFCASFEVVSDAQCNLLFFTFEKSIAQGIRQLKSSLVWQVL